MLLNFDHFKLITFDCYGTLIDWETGIINALNQCTKTKGITLKAEQALELYAKFESEVEAEGYRIYKDVLEEVLIRICNKLDLKPTEDELHNFSWSVRTWPPFPDSTEALKILQQNYRLGVLSNIDDDLFSYSEELLDIRFDEFVSAQQIQSYKPRKKHFLEVLRRLNYQPKDVLHVAQSLFHDIKPASELGFTTVWVNRRYGKPGSGATPLAAATPDFEVKDLKSLVSIMKLEEKEIYPVAIDGLQ